MAPPTLMALGPCVPLRDTVCAFVSLLPLVQEWARTQDEKERMEQRWWQR